MINSLNVGGGGLKSSTITINTNPSNATLVLKDEKGNIVQPLEGKTYKLKNGIYKYNVSLEGYYSLENEKLYVLEDATIQIKKLDKILYATFVLFPTDATLVVKNGNGEILTPETDNTYKIKAGVYSYSVTAENYQTITDRAFEMTEEEGNKNIQVSMIDSSIYGARRQISSTPTAWERTNNAVGLVANANVSTTPVQNDFNQIYPWSDIKTCDVSKEGIVNKYYGDADFSFTSPSGYIMVEIPEFFWKREQKDGYEYIYISRIEHEGFTKSKKFYIGRYDAGGTASAINSKSGVSPLVNITRAQARTAAKAISVNWGQLDIEAWSIIEMLYIVEYADYNCQSKIGFGVCSGSTINSGACDSLGDKSGCLNNDKKSAVLYRGIENLWGNVYQWLDGINITNRQAWISKNPNDFTDDKFASPYTKVGYVNGSSNGYISKVGYDANNPEIQLPIETSGADTTHISDYYYQGTGNNVVYVGGHYSNDLLCGLWCWYCHYASSSSYSYFGCRLLLRPV